MADATKPKTSANEKTDAALFSKEQLMASQKYSGRRDILSALLDDKKLYSAADVDAAIEKYAKGAVK